jgi:hypothetical protein
MPPAELRKNCVVRTHSERELTRRNVGVDVERATRRRVRHRRHNRHIALVHGDTETLDVHLDDLADQTVRGLVEQLRLKDARVERASANAARLERVDETRIAVGEHAQRDCKRRFIGDANAANELRAARRPTRAAR